MPVKSAIWIRADSGLLLVPRHPGRFDAVKTWLRSRNVRFVMRSTREAVAADTSVLLVDTLGELLSFPLPSSALPCWIC